MTKLRLLAAGYLITIFGLFLYSFTQVDLGLTLTRLSIWQAAQKFFQTIGYFNRPLSTFFYLAIILLLYLFYLFFLKLARKEKISKKVVWTLILASTLMLTFSYNAFSYDLFNNIFDAKIVTYYHQNPYLHTALDFPKDPMLSFMHWTHRTYPYGPVWLVFSVPISFLGMQIFLATFFLFKILSAAFFLGTIFFAGKIMRKVSPKHELLGITFLALNPLFLIEGLVSAHNDMAMLFLLVVSIFLLLNSKYIRSLFLLIFSVGIKFATVFAVPVFLIIYLLKIKKISVGWEKIFVSLIVLMSAAIIAASVRTNFQPWYILYILPLAALISGKNYIKTPVIIVSFFALLTYVPFLYLGNWDPPVPIILFWTMAASVFVAGFALIFALFRKQKMVE